MYQPRFTVCRRITRQRIYCRTRRGLSLVAGCVVMGAVPALVKAEETRLAEVQVVDKRESQGTQVLDRSTIDAMTGGNGDITSLLKISPNVQFGNSQMHTGQQGEIAPADISINGAKFYENLYQIDGMSINNDINPAGNNPNSATDPVSASQGFAVDTSLLCRVTIRDSNIGAEFGHFNGGVVSADTCASTRKFGGRVSVETTRSDWMEYKIAPEERLAYDQSADQDREKKFEKWTYRAALEGKPSDELGVIASFVRRTSEIPLRAYASGNNSGTDANTKTEKRLLDNAFVRGFWSSDATLEADLSFQDSPGEENHFIKNTRNSFFTLKTGGQAVNAGLKSRQDGVTLSSRLNWSTMNSSRDADANVLKTWRYSATDKNWGYQSSATTWNSSEGGYGDVNQQQETLNYTLKADWDAIALLGGSHRFQAGVELEKKSSFYERKTQYELYSVSTNTASCALAGGGVDTEYCSLAPTWNSGTGQYLKNRMVYFAGKFTVQDKSQGLFLQDEFVYGPVKSRLGLRYERSDLAPKPSVSARSAFFWDVFDNDKTQLEAGFNRYAGRNFMQYYTYRERLSLQTTSLARASAAVLWGTPVASTTANMYHLGELSIPYEDETVLAFRQKWAGFLWGAKSVQRKSRDEVVLTLRSVGNYWWDNIGKADNDTFSLTAETLAPLQAFGTSTSVLAAIDRTQTRTSHANYADTISISGGDLEQQVMWNGKVIRWIDRPADNYNRPYSARLLLNTYVPSARLHIGNLFRYRAGYEKMILKGTVMNNGSAISNYEKGRFGSAITWDMRFNWALPTVTGQEATVTLSIENVLNRTNAIEDSGTYLTYEKGRQFWLELGYKF